MDENKFTMKTPTLVPVWILAVMGSLLASNSRLAAQSVPSLINYQGQLTDAAGQPLPTADYVLTFSIHDAAIGGNMVWGPQIFDATAGPGHGPKIPAVQGYFNVMLGPVDASAPTPRQLSEAFAGADRYVEIKVGNADPLQPRQRILSAPYALKAADTAKLGGHDWSAVFGVNDPINGKVQAGKIAEQSVDTVHLRANAVKVEQIAPDAIQTRHLANGSITSDKLALGSINHLSASDGEPANAVSVDAGGNVGIGTTAPKAQLDIDSNLKVGRALRLEDYPLGGAAAEKIYTDATLNDAHLILGAHSRDDLVIRRENGNVGIGTTAPQAKLDIAGTLQIAAMAQQSLGKNGYVKIGELIVQWGQETTAHNILNPDSTTLTFPIPFPNEVLIVIPGIYVNTGPQFGFAAIMGVSSVTTTQVTFLWNELVSNTQSMRASYIAIGR